MFFRSPGLEHYQRLIEAARSHLADLELDYGVEKSKVDSVRSRLFGALRPYYQERDRLRLLIQYRLDHTLMELRSLYEHLQARILELIETLDTLRASPDYEVFPRRAAGGTRAGDCHLAGRQSEEEVVCQAVPVMIRKWYCGTKPRAA